VIAYSFSNFFGIPVDLEFILAAGSFFLKDIIGDITTEKTFKTKHLLYRDSLYTGNPSKANMASGPISTYS